MRGLSVESRFGDRVEFMASDHEWRPDGWLHQSTITSSQRVHRTQAELEDIEHQNLSLLLKVFPGISLHSIAEAYTRADGDPNYAAELLAMGSLSSPYPDTGQRTDRHAVQDKFSEDGKFFEPSHKPLETSFHFDKVSEQLDEAEKQNGGSVFSRETPGVHNHSGRPPEANSCDQWETPGSGCQSACQSGVTSGSSAGCHGRNGIYEASNSSAKGSVGGVAAGNCASNGTGNTFSCSGSSLLPGWKGFSHSNKVSAISGTVSCHRQRRSGFSQHDAGKDSKDCKEGDEVFFYGKQKKKKKKGGIGKNEDTGNLTDASKNQNQKAAEEFLHSMLGDGFELGLDVVRDVLEHFSGDTNKALETLLHMASTSPGFHVNEFPDQVSEPSQNLGVGFPNKDPVEAWISFQESDDDLLQATNTLLQREIGANNVMSTDVSDLCNFDHILSKLHESFPSVELSFLSEVLRASDLSYGDAVQALKEAGMTPVKERCPSKVDPAEVLQALFKKEPPDNTIGAGSSIEHQNTSGELYTVVATRARARISAADCKPLKAKVDEYEKHRGSANDHWSTMKRYFQEAAAAHSRGERALAGVLSQKGQLFRGLAREASLRASENIFNVKNRDIENNITIDLHAQHVLEAFRMLKLHLRSLSSISSVHTLTVITGHGSHSANGRAKIKPALTQYLTKMHIPWVEPNAGCLIIKISDVKAHYPAGHRSSDSSSDESQ